MHDDVRVIAGECTTTFEGQRTAEHRGDVVAVCKPDGTVLVHDAAGYQPVAWLTRAETVRVADDTLDARDGDQHLRVEVHDEYATARHPVSRAGVPVGTCPGCEGALVLADDRVTCLGCLDGYGVPGDAAVLDDDCPTCGLPLLAVERGERFEVCADRECESLDDRVRERFDGEWDCPECDGGLRILRRGGLLAGCDQYPDCETGFAFPTGVVDGTCDCGLPVFETPSGRRCLDADCEC
jgi:DNA topoisomerase-1